MEQCKNCDATFEGNFCSNCGQKQNNGRIVFKESARDVLENYFDFDAPLFRTIKDLFIRPGEMIRNYIRGKRKSYAHPFRYFVFILAIYLVVKNLLDFDPIRTFSEATGNPPSPNPDGPISKASNYFSEHINSFLFIFALALSFFARIFNRKSGYNFVEYFALSLFILGQYIFVSLFITIFSITLSPVFFLFNYLVVFFYPAFVLANFHEGNLFVRIIKSALVSLFAWFSYAFIGFYLAYLIVIFFNL